MKGFTLETKEIYLIRSRNGYNIIVKMRIVNFRNIRGIVILGLNSREIVIEPMFYLERLEFSSEQINVHIICSI